MLSVKPSKLTKKGPSSKPTKGQAAVKVLPDAALSSEENSGDSEDDGVDEEGMARLMKALGDDGLDEFETAQLRALAVDKDGSSEDDNWEDEEEGAAESSEDEENEASGEDSDEDGEEGTDEEEQIDEAEEQDVALDDVESVDEDAVPRQKIEIDNTVWDSVYIDLYPLSFCNLGCT